MDEKYRFLVDMQKDYGFICVVGREREKKSVFVSINVCTYLFGACWRFSFDSLPLKSFDVYGIYKQAND